MLRHLLQPLAAYPTLAEGIAPPGLLHPIEQTQFDAFRVVKRRRDWLLGRWTAKHLIQQHLAHMADAAGGKNLGGETPPLHALLILVAPDGAPYAALSPSLFPVPSSPLPIPLPIPLSISLSISHSGDRAFCALTDEPGVCVGADIERIEPREPGFLERFFTSAEIAAVRAAPVGQRDTLVTVIWSGKEAVLKALRLGLRVDTRRVECLPAAGDGATGWVSARARIDAALGAGPLRLWWSVADAYALTMAAYQASGSVDMAAGPEGGSLDGYR